MILTARATARGPCPGMNTLANHEYLPSNGRAITRDILADAMLEGYNIARSDAILLFSQAVRTNPAPFAQTFDLDTLGCEGVLEHDFSLRYTHSCQQSCKTCAYYLLQSLRPLLRRPAPIQRDRLGRDRILLHDARNHRAAGGRRTHGTTCDIKEDQSRAHQVATRRRLQLGRVRVFL